jgi:hypothetical protein
MRKYPIIAVGFFAGLLCLSMSSFPSAARAENAPSNGGCEARYLNSSKVLDWLNSSVGQRRGFPSRVGSVGDITPANPVDLSMLGLPGTEGVVVGGHPAAIACHVTVVLQNGLRRSGILNVIAPSHKIFSPGADQSLIVAWAPDEVIESVRQQQLAIQERNRKEQRENLQRAHAMMQNASSQNACYQGWKIAVEAKSLLSAESPDQVVNDLVTRYAYGPNGEIYRDSEDMAAMIKHIISSIQMTPEERQVKRVPDYASQEFLSSCPAKMRQLDN